ncbi:MAG: M13 family peptidase [Lysobacteraceae bacterium]|nr:MAG: M13 family peptidase [Xanthomonadaceae bacterium]
MPLPSKRFLALAISACLSGAAHAAAPSFDVRELDPAILPCADFDGFVNSKWVAGNPIPADRTRWGAFDVLREHSLVTQHAIVDKATRTADTAKAGSIEQKIGWYYRSGMDEQAIEKAGLAPIRPELARIDALRSGADVAAYLTAAFAQGQGRVFGLFPAADFKNSKMQIAYAFQDGLGLPTPEYYELAEHAAKRDAYRAHVAKVLTLAGATPADAKAAADHVLAFETRLAKASFKPVELRTPENQYHFTTLAEADQATPNFSWTKFFAAQRIDIKGGFSLSQPKFFAEFNRMLADVPVEQWRSYLRFHALDSASPYLSQAFARENFEFYKKTLNGQKEQEPRWKRVLESVNDTMGMALGELYVAEAFPPESRRRAQELVDNVSAALKARIEKLDWMGEETRAKALEKWSTFLPKIGYPDRWRDWTGLSIKPDDYYANVIASRRHDHAYEMAKIGKPTDRSEWGMTPQTVNAYYNPTDNTINFPAAILQPPFFDAKADDALNYGGIGAVIGHEAIHGYDDEGSQFDAQGNNTNWWSKADREKFEARAAKLVEQYESYEPLPGKRINGRLTLGENIADLGGTAIALDALHMAIAKDPSKAAKIDGFTPDQRFFLNLARIWRGSTRPERLEVQLNSDPHSPANYRAVGAASNLPAFAGAFDCKAGDAMVRGDDKRVKIW